VEAGGQAVASRCSQLFELSFLSKSTRQNKKTKTKTKTTISEQDPKPKKSQLCS